MKFTVVLLLLVALIAQLSAALPMTNDAELVALDSNEEKSEKSDARASAGQRQEAAHMVIAPRKLDEEPVEPRSAMFDTIVEELHAAGVQTADKRQLETLSYKDLTRLLALWHLTQRRTYYEADENRAPPTTSD
ncbi:uncharacterized protein LOC133849339 [Drosophila sulfurigaster albostrigata]|uniref:uncharacterized protein LOC133849339 n=1 Tax=Drosophila sulfurigaster albostrigata TaxID=89887 RepID=UPI002D21DBDE|nr:uncharacterized protein LOC133849339 [Drosophila sulfurigaster albostrigata]